MNAVLLLVASAVGAEPVCPCQNVLAAPMPPQNVLAVAPARIERSPRPDGLGYCSDACRCGCVEGAGCSCGAPSRQRTTTPTSTPTNAELEAMTQHWRSQPARSAPARSCNSGG